MEILMFIGLVGLTVWIWTLKMDLEKINSLYCRRIEEHEVKLREDILRLLHQTKEEIYGEIDIKLSSIKPKSPRKKPSKNVKVVSRKKGAH